VLYVLELLESRTDLQGKALTDRTRYLKHGPIIGASTDLKTGYLRI